MTNSDSTPERSFAETALELGGKSREESQRTGAIDRADDQVETLFQPQHQTAQSPVHRAVWDRTLPLELFAADRPERSPAVQEIMDRSLALVTRHRQTETLYGPDGKVAPTVLAELAAAGYWGLLISAEYGGAGCSFREFASFLTRMATVDPTVAGLASVHGCIGAVDPLRTFGNRAQRAQWLPKLASGERLSAFALTEPGAGSDLTALKTTAVRQGDQFLITGEKLFITNAAAGRTLGLVCLLDNKPQVLIVDLPAEENEHWHLVHYGLHALRHTANRGLRFRNFPVPVENLLTAPKGNGLTIAYHGLNLGRVALCANAAGVMRILLASILPWANHRQTYGQAIARRELVQRRIGRLAGLIVAADALVAWCSSLLDQGYRGEIECIIAKVFGSAALQEAAIELCLKTHGGRSFLHGHLVGDHLHDYLAPGIYEGEGEMLSLALFKTLVKQHGMTFFEPVGKALHQHGWKSLSPWNVSQLWQLRGVLAPYAGWLAKERWGRKQRTGLPEGTAEFGRHLDFACRELQRLPLTIDRVLRKHQLKLADRQCRMAALSARVQQLITLLCTAMAGSKATDPLTRAAADVFCWETMQKLTGREPDDRFFRAITTLGGQIAAGNWSELAGIPELPVLMRE